MKRFAPISFLLLLLSIFFVSGCISKNADLINTYSYHDVILILNYSGSERIAIAVHDQRTAVVAGEKLPTYVGTVMDIIRQKYDTHTESGRQLAADMANSISMSFRYNGFRAVPVFVSHADRPEAVFNKLLKKRASRFILITLYTWESETYKNTTLFYDLRVDVYDRDGTLLTRNKTAGEADVEGSLSGPHTSAKILVPDMVRRRLETIFNDYKIAEALN